MKDNFFSSESQIFSFDALLTQSEILNTIDTQGSFFAEDDHIAYINPFSISILRSFALNLYQIYFNKHKDEKILSPRTKTTMANISHCCKHDDELVSNLLEQ